MIFKKTILTLFILFTANEVFSGEKDDSSMIFMKKFMDYFDKDMIRYSKMIFLQSERDQSYQAPKSELKKTLIYNQEVYADEDMKATFPAEGVTVMGNIIKVGNALKYKDIPIGYNIILPNDREIRGVIVEVYGGLGEARKSLMFKPSNTAGLDGYLVENGIVIITLNLVDLIKLKKAQSQMPQDVHTELHESINHFFEVLKNNPEAIHKDLKALREKKIVLFGASFGGRTSIRHAELYPGTFDAYISHNGALSWKETDRMMPGKTKTGVKESEWLSPMVDRFDTEVVEVPDKKIILVADPILLLHNVDDNRVFVNASVEWYKRALNSGKKNLVQLYITDVGNPAPGEDIGTKGHYAPTGKEAFENYAQTVLYFILNGPSNLTSTSQWLAHKKGIKAAKYDPTTSVEDKFISKAYQIYTDSLKERPSLGTGITASGIMNEANQNVIWQKLYLPILYVISYVETLKNDPNKLEEEMNYLKESGVLTSTVLENGLEKILPLFFVYLKERYNFQMPAGMTADQVSENIDLQGFYMIWLTDFQKYIEYWDPDIDAAAFILESLYMGNMDKIEIGLIQLEKFQKVMTVWYDKSEEVKNKFLSKIQQNEENVKAVWKEAIREGLKRQRIQDK